MTATGWSDAAYAALAELLGTQTGLWFAPHRYAEAEAGARRAMAKAGIRQPSEYLSLLRQGRIPLDGLIAELTVGETYFFREPGHFEFIRNRVLAGLRQSGRGRVKVWSAGCASGEEAYSLAILLEQEGFAGNAHLLATDLSRAALVRAQAGVYGKWSMRGLDERTLERYFARKGSHFTVAERFRRRVTFEFLNLAGDAYPSFVSGAWDMDLILCRNVLIYFDRPCIAAVARKLFDTLAPGGWLITGPSDPPLSEYAPFETVVAPQGVFYCRTPDVPAKTSHGIPQWWPEPEAEVPDQTVAEAAVEPPPGLREPLAEARAAFQAGRYALAAELAAACPSNPEACILRVRAIANWGDLPAARQAANEAVVAHPLRAELRFLRGVILMNSGEDAEAARAFRKALYLDASLAIAHFTLGATLVRLGELAGARRAYANARRLAAAGPPDRILPFSDGERAGRLALAAADQLSLLDVLEKTRR